MYSVGIQQVIGSLSVSVEKPVVFFARGCPAQSDYMTIVDDGTGERTQSSTDGERPSQTRDNGGHHVKIMNETRPLMHVAAPLLFKLVSMRHLDL